MMIHTLLMCLRVKAEPTDTDTYVKRQRETEKETERNHMRKTIPAC
jgi:hypothetical protein